jgi:tetratricopeptide (TPR) repeat protein
MSGKNGAGIFTGAGSGWGMRFASTLLAIFLLVSSAWAASEEERRSCARAGDPDQAITACTRIIERAGDNPEHRADALSARGQAHRQKRQYDQALTDLNEAIRLKPDSVGALYRRGNVYRDMRDYDRTIADFDQVLRLQPNFAGGFLNRGYVWEAKGDRERAKADYQAALAIGAPPADPRTHQQARERLAKLETKTEAPAPPKAAPAASPSYPQLARQGYALSQAEAEGLESLLKNSPDDLVARTKILGFYFRGGAMRLYGRDATIEARRRHILWLIEHHPEFEVVALSEATIDRAGHALADKAGYEQASKLWIEQARGHENSAAVLRHAARFFLLSDKERALSLLKQAQHAAPANRELSSRIGYVYALAILGVDMINSNGLPTSHNPAEAKGDFAMRAIDELNKSSDSIVLAEAGMIVGRYGLILAAIYRGTDRFTVDYVPLSEAFLIKAQALEPANPAWPSILEKLR